MGCECSVAAPSGAPAPRVHPKQELGRGKTIGWAIRDEQQRSGVPSGRCRAARLPVESSSGNLKHDRIEGTEAKVIEAVNKLKDENDCCLVTFSEGQNDFVGPRRVFIDSFIPTRFSLFRLVPPQ